MSTVKHQTASGISLEFHVQQKNAPWKDIAGVYAFGTPVQNGTYHVQYVGQALSFKDRLSNHERWNEAQRLGATHVLAMVVPRQADRDKIEATLINELRPTLNKIGK